MTKLEEISKKSWGGTVLKPRSIKVISLKYFSYLAGAVEVGAQGAHLRTQYLAM